MSWKGPSEAAWCHSLQCTGTATAPAVLRAPSSLTLAVCRDGAPPPLWATCATASPPSVPNLLPYLQPQSPLLYSEAISPSPITQTPLWSLPPSFSQPLQTLTGRYRSPCSLPFSSCTAQLSAWPRREGFHPRHHFCVPPLDALQQLHVSPALRTPPVDAVLQVRCLHRALVQPRVPLALL